jgi:cytochrome P450
VDNLIELIPKDGQPVDLQPLFFKLTLDTTTELIFGASINTLKQEGGDSQSKEFAEQFDTAQNFVVQRFRLLDLYWLIGGQKFKRSCATVHDFVDNIIETSQREAQKDPVKTSRYLFFNTIAQQYNDKRAVREQLVNVLLAGRDTTACLLTWSL